MKVNNWKVLEKELLNLIEKFLRSSANRRGGWNAICLQLNYEHTIILHSTKLSRKYERIVSKVGPGEILSSLRNKDYLNLSEQVQIPIDVPDTHDMSDELELSASEMLEHLSRHGKYGDIYYTQQFERVVANVTLKLRINETLLKFADSSRIHFLYAFADDTPTLVDVYDDRSPSHTPAFPYQDYPDHAKLSKDVELAASKGRKGLQKLIAVLNAGEIDHLENVLDKLCEMGPEAREAVPALIRWLGCCIGSFQGRPEYPAPVAAALVAIDPNGEVSKEGLLEVLHGEDKGAAWEAAVALSSMLDRNPALLGDLEHLIAGDVPGALAIFLNSLFRNPHLAKPLLAEFVELLPSVEKADQINVLRVIGKLGPDATEAVPHIMKLLSDGKYDVAALAGVLKKIGPAARYTLPELQEILKKQPAGWARDNLVDAIAAISGEESPLEANAKVARLRERRRAEKRLRHSTS
ncbi:MAG: hypothetical protein J5J00_14850 [Deltaproteobacteria bacterium]|nr:hypothetical protein [Deltaproteobacteria bacterium]